MKHVGQLCLIQFCLVVGLFAECALAQLTVPAPKVPEQSAAPSGPITFDVMVTDKAGHPVTGLQQSDFTVFDDRHPISIQSFAAHDAPAQENSEGIILLMDEVNTGFRYMSIERIQMANLLRQNQGHLPAPVSLVLFTDDGVKPLGPPSTDGNALANLLQQQKGQLRALRRSGGFYYGEEAFQMSVGALENIAHAEAKVPGRKLLIWVGPGWWVFDNPNVYFSDRQQRGFFRAVVDMSNTMRQAEMSLYMVDPRGMGDAGSIYTFLWQNYLKPVQGPNQANPGDLALQVLATQTGGKVFFASNDLAGEISQCMQDAQGWYTLTFAPQTADKPETWHDVAVKVDKPGAIVRTRNGYYTAPQRQ